MHWARQPPCPKMPGDPKMTKLVDQITECQNLVWGLLQRARVPPPGLLREDFTVR